MLNLCARSFKKRAWIPTWTKAIHREEAERSSDPRLSWSKFEWCQKTSLPPHVLVTLRWTELSLWCHIYYLIDKWKALITFLFLKQNTCDFLFTRQLCAGLKLSGSVGGLTSCTARGEGFCIPALHLCVFVPRERGAPWANWQGEWQRWSASKEEP